MRGNFITNKHGPNNPNFKDGRKGTRLYRIYNGMKTRCYNPNFPTYKNYGARGVVMCPEWLLDFRTFRDWAISHGYRDDLTIDRIDVNGNYEPNNCRWTNAYIQANNTRVNHIVTINGVNKTLKEWSDEYRINYKTVRDRLKRGWSYYDALTIPPDTRYRKRVVE